MHPSLARLQQAHSVKVLLAVDPALLAVDANLDPYISVYAEIDCFGILIPGDWHPGFEVLDLALRLYDHVFGSGAVIGFGKKTHKRELIIAVAHSGSTERVENCAAFVSCRIKLT